MQNEGDRLKAGQPAIFRKSVDLCTFRMLGWSPVAPRGLWSLRRAGDNNQRHEISKRLLPVTNMRATMRRKTVLPWLWDFGTFRARESFQNADSVAQVAGLQGKGRPEFFVVERAEPTPEDEIWREGRE